MRVAVFSDIHGNWPAFEAVLEDAQDVDRALCLGDIVGYGGDPVRCLDEVRERGWPALVGNHDRACTDPQILAWFNDDAATVIHWTKDLLGEDRLGWLRQLPEVQTEDGVLLVHASPRDPIFEYVLDGATAAANLDLLGDRACLHGHTHIPGYFYPDGDTVQHNYWLGRVRVHGPVLINPGSVGQPRDGDPRAAWLELDLDTWQAVYHRTEYDIAGAAAAIRAARLPDSLAERLSYGQ
jgi:diadenosine tetraphosphatase ApaH/serine/threonine PP2A family protein phosphatase